MLMVLSPQRFQSMRLFLLLLLSSLYSRRWTEALQQMPPPPKSHTSNFGTRKNHPSSYTDSPAFLGPIHLPEDSTSTSDHHVRIRNWYELQNEKELSDILESSLKIGKKDTNKSHVVKNTKSTMTDIIHHFARSDAPVDVKEVCESVEFVMRMRKRLIGHVTKKQKQQKIPVEGKEEIIQLHDLCCGHGLTGMLFAASYGPGKLHVNLVDRTQPSSYLILKNLVTQICPWVDDQVTYISSSLDEWNEQSQIDSADVVISTHACGSLTDRVLEFAVQQKAESVAVMPCCYTGTDSGSPYGIKRALGVGKSFFSCPNYNPKKRKRKIFFQSYLLHSLQRLFFTLFLSLFITIYNIIYVRTY